MTACCRLLSAGPLRPAMRDCCAGAVWSVSTGRRAFGSSRRAASRGHDDIAARHGILGLITGAERRAPGTNASWRLVKSALLERT